MAVYTKNFENTFASNGEFTKFVGFATRALGVHSRTSKDKAVRTIDYVSRLREDYVVEDYGIDVPHFVFKLRRVINGINYGLRTGRLHQNAERMLRELSGYQYTKLVIKLTMACATEADVVAYLNGRDELELPIQA